MAHSTETLWHASTVGRRWPTLAEDLEVDVAIVGGGITGLTAALRLTQAGKRVALLEMREVGGGETGNTTAHLTEVLDSRYHQLESKFGREGSRLAAESSRAAIDDMEARVRELRIDCGFARVPAFLYAEDERGADALRQELEPAQRAGLSVNSTTEVPLPFPVTLALHVARQAQLHPLEYLAAVADAAARSGALLFEQTPVQAVDDGDPCTVSTAQGHTVRARAVFVCANVPVNNRLFFHTKSFPYRTYALSGAAARLPPPGLYWDLQDPYHYTRTHQGQLIVGGEDHKVGAEPNTSAAHDRLEAFAREKFGLESVSHRWSGQVIEPTDGLPFIGLNSASAHVYVATGYSGNGMTFGTLAARIVSDLILGASNPWAALFTATRIKPVASAATFVSENVDFPANFLKDRLKPSAGHATDAVARGEGKILTLGHKKVAVYRDAAGACHAVSPVCTHLACHVRFNPAETSWDCPCHGGRFSATGEVLNGPPVTPLECLDAVLPPHERAREAEEADPPSEAPTTHAPP